jgi:hypothetical protein
VPIIINYINSLYSSVLYGGFLFINYKDIFDKTDKKIRKCIRKYLKIGLVNNKILFTILGLNCLTNLIKIEKIMTAIRLYHQSNNFRKSIESFSFNSGYPQLPSNFNEKTKFSSSLSNFNNLLLDNNLKFITKKEKYFNYGSLKIRARKNILKRNINFYFNNLSPWRSLNKKNNFEMKYNSYSFLKNNLLKDNNPIKNIPTLIYIKNNEKIIIGI